MNAVEREACDQISSRIISGAYRVSNTLGAGFLEKVYENAMAIELRQAGMDVDQQRPVHVRYREEIVGEYIPD